MKRVIVIFLVIGLIFSVGIIAVSAEKTATKLSSLSEEECRQLLLDYGVTIPKELNDISVKTVFAELEKDPYRIVIINWTTLYNLYEDIRMVVKKHYGLPDTVLTNNLSSTSRYMLQYSTRYDWDYATVHYNCYSFVVGRLDNKYSPGQFSGGNYDHLGSVELLALTVKADLHGDLGRSCVKIQSNCPSSTIGWENVMAVRKDTTMDMHYEGMPYNDFHFAKLTDEGWLHKPGTTAILKFNNAPSNDVDWTNESYDLYWGYVEGTVTYDSQIKYILYKTNHGSASNSRWTGDHYHKGAYHWFKYEILCGDCGDAVDTEWVSSACSGPPCLIERPGIFMLPDQE